MALNKNAIETLSVNAVRDSVVMSAYLDQYIPDKDKEPSWDGAVYIYKSEKHAKNNLHGRMPVQVKGTENDDFSKSEISFSAETSDLRNYLNDGGVIFFVVYLGNGGLTKKIYYIELTPIKLRLLLSEAKAQKSKTIKLKEFPNDNDKKATIFLNCWKNCKLQASFSDAKLLTLEELEEQGLLEGVTVPLSGVGFTDMQMAFVSNEVYLYAKIKGSTVPQPIEMLPHKMHTQEEKDAAITIDGKQFYSEICIVKSKEKITYVIGNSFTMTFPVGQVGCTVNYKPSNQLRIFTKDLDFLLAFIDNGYFKLNGLKFPFDYANADFSNFNIDEQRKNLEIALKIVQVLDILGCKKDIQIDKISKNDWRNINYLITAFVDKESVTNLKNDLPLVTKYNVADLCFILCFFKDEEKEGTYSIVDFFQTNMMLTYTGRNGSSLPLSQYAILRANDMLVADNIRYDVLLPSFKSVERHEELIDRANWFLLELLTAFDKSGNKEILNTAKEFSDWIMEASEEEISYSVRILNHLQTIKRMRDFNEEETRVLYSLLDDGNSTKQVCIGTYLLLGQQIAAEMNFAKLTSEEQTEFKTYPIYHFWKDREEQDNG